ncbi:MAG TPA: coproporphyrinogen-III oxidase family protein, partial [Rhabdochlamydiaceae bacterium]|nr:coproporphyrinogen-III oxidase family protein [Rhabdochlamydiaceae bacterium]
STEQIKAFSDLGINRISIGVQSLDDSSLQILDRRHTAKRSIEAIHTSSDGGIDNISIDLMYELPEQTLQSWQHTLQMAESLPITHLSLYNLTFEPHTVFFKKKKELLPRVPAAETSLAMLQEAVAVLEHIGLKRYEISAFAKAGFASRHNSGYWTARPFLGFGPSAFSYWDKKRYSNVSNLNQYSAALKKGLTAVDFEELLPCPDSQKELLAIELRLLRGVDLKNFQARHGNLPNEVLLNLELLQSKGWIERDGTRIKLSPEGLLFYDSIGEILI